MPGACTVPARGKWLDLPPRACRGQCSAAANPAAETESVIATPAHADSEPLPPPWPALCDGRFFGAIQVTFVSIPAEVRFSEKFFVDEETGCWIWTAGKNRRGYGKFRIGKKTIPAHRAALIIYKGIDLPSDVFACHHCDRPECVNPEHIFFGAPRDNSGDMVAKKRHAFGERNGRAKLTESKVIEIRAAIGRHQEIASLFGVSKSLVRMIKSRQIWRCVQ